MHDAEIQNALQQVETQIVGYKGSLASDTARAFKKSGQAAINGKKRTIWLFNDILIVTNPPAKKLAGKFVYKWTINLSICSISVPVVTFIRTRQF